MPNLSLLSRGAGQVVKTTQEKLEVLFRPEDYFNWKPPEYHGCVSRSLDNCELMEGPWGVYLPKTYNTRTDAPVLYSEGLAKSSSKMKGCKKSQRRLRGKSRIHIAPHTLQDLVRAILAYGGKRAWKDQKETVWQPNLHFLRDPATQAERQMRPGYSAKRYLLRLAQTLDPRILQKLQCAGHIKDPFVLEEILSYHRNKEQDLSAIPPKYNFLPIFFSPCSYLWAEQEKVNPEAGCGGTPSGCSCASEWCRTAGVVHFHLTAEECGKACDTGTSPFSTGLGLSSYNKSGNEAWPVEGPEGEKHARGKARIPFRISIRKLSFHLGPQHTKKNTWNLKAAYRSNADDPNVGIHQCRESTKEDEGQREIVNQSSDCPALKKIHTDTSELWCEKSHVTFYGGSFPGRKISENVNQRHPKHPGSRPFGFLPLIQPGRRSEQKEVKKPPRRQMSEIFRLPVISEDPLRAHRQKLKSRELPKELMIIPLLVQLERAPHTEGKKPRVAACHKPSSEARVCNNLLVPLPNDHFSEAEHRNKEQQAISGETPETPQCGFYLPPIRNGEFALSRAKTRKGERDAKMHKQHRRESDLGIQDGIPTLDQLPAITRKKDPGGQENRANFETSTSTNTGIDGVCKNLVVGIINSSLQEELGACYNGTSLSSLPMSPVGEIVCTSHLGSVQATEGPEHCEFFPAEEVDDIESLEIKIRASRSQPEISFSAPQFDEKVIPQTQEVGKVPENENSLPAEQNIMGYRSNRVEFRQEIQPGQDGFCGNSLLGQKKQKERLSSVPETQGPKQKKGTGKQVENLPQSERSSHLEPCLSQWMVPESEMVLDFSVLEFPGLSKEPKDSPGMDIHLSEKQNEAEEDDATTLPEKPSLQTKSTDYSSAGDGLEIKLMTRQKKHELRKTEPGSKAKKKSTTKDKRQSRAEFVVGKPKLEKAVRKTASFSKEKPDVRRAETPDKTKEEEEHKEVDAEVEQIVTDTEEDTLGGRLDKSPSSLCFTEEGSLPPETGHAFPADVDHLYRSPGSPAALALETSIATLPIVSTATDSQTSVIANSERPEVLPETNREEKLSRERIIAERAEKRRLAVERKRRELEEFRWKQQEEQERMERMKEEMEKERWQRIEEIRLRKQQLEEERQQQEEEAARKLQAEKIAQERLRQQQEELRRKLLEAQKKKEEEDRDLAEAEKRRQKEREMWLEEERQHLAEMAEEQRVKYEKQKQEAEERARCEAEERRKKAEEATSLALEEARKQALLLARQKAEQEEKDQFQHKLFVEASGLERQQNISRPWVYSYFQQPFLKLEDED